MRDLPSRTPGFGRMRLAARIVHCHWRLLLPSSLLLLCCSQRYERRRWRRETGVRDGNFLRSKSPVIVRVDIVPRVRGQLLTRAWQQAQQEEARRDEDDHGSRRPVQDDR